MTDKLIYIMFRGLILLSTFFEPANNDLKIFIHLSGRSIGYESYSDYSIIGNDHKLSVTYFRCDSVYSSMIYKDPGYRSFLKKHAHSSPYDLSANDRIRIKAIRDSLAKIYSRHFIKKVTITKNSNPRYFKLINEVFRADSSAIKPPPLRPGRDMKEGTGYKIVITNHTSERAYSHYVPSLSPSLLYNLANATCNVSGRKNYYQ